VRFAVTVFISGLVVLFVILGARALNARAWRRSLVAFRLSLPANLSPDDVARWFATISATTNPPRWALLPMSPVCLQIVADARAIRHYLLVSEGAQDRVLSGLRATLPGVRLTAEPDFAAKRPRYRLAAEATLTSRLRPLTFDRAEAASAALLAALQPVLGDSEIHVQLIVTGAGTPQPVSSRTKQDGSPVMPWWLESSAPTDADAVRAERNKLKEPILEASLRVAIVSHHRAEAYKLLSRVWPTLHATNNPGVRVVRRWLPSRTVARRMAERQLPITRWPALLNAPEAVAFAGFPLGGVALPGLALSVARQLPPAPGMAQRGSVIGVSNYPGSEGRPLVLKTADRLRHQFLLGPTGSGKSWLLANLVLQDIAGGYGVVCVDVKGDLVGDVLSRIEDKDAERIVVIDASRRDRPIGFNVLGHAHAEEARELVVDNVLHIFKEIWSAFWGPRSDQILRASLSTLVHARAMDGSAYTLCEVLPLLTQPQFRRAVLASAAIPDSLQAYWQFFDRLSDGERTQAISPLANKLDAFTSRTPIRLMLGQSQGFDLTGIYRERQAVLVNLAKGSLGAETSALLGSLLVSSLWQATLARVNVPADRRRPVFAYLDEMQDIVRLPLGLSEMLAQARGLGLGITLATQFLHQIPESLRSAVFGTVRTMLAFQLDHEDARLLAKRFAPLTADDLTGLAAWEVALRPCVDGQTLGPVTGTTVRLPEALRDPAELAEASRQRYGVPRAEAEAAMRSRIVPARQRRPRVGHVERETTG
jgi:hypothetical protein